MSRSSRCEGQAAPIEQTPECIPLQTNVDALDAAIAELAAARARLDEITASLAEVTMRVELCRLEREELQAELFEARKDLHHAHHEVSDLGRFVRSIVVGSRRSIALTLPQVESIVACDDAAVFELLFDFTLGKATLSKGQRIDAGHPALLGYVRAGAKVVHIAER